METTWNAAAVTLHPATPADVAEVLDVLDETAAWLRGKGVTQWPDHFESAWVEGASAPGQRDDNGPHIGVSRYELALPHDIAT
jgi:hypothetical protein